MKKHSETNHESFPKFYCHKCEQRYNREEKLQCHIEKVHEHTIVQTNDLKMCDAEFIDDENVTRHAKDYHRIDLSFRCQHCENTFQNENLLINHMEVCNKGSVIEKTF